MSLVKYVNHAGSAGGRAVVLAAMVAMGATGCVAVTIMENPTTGQRVNCTAEAMRLAYAKDPSASTGKDVPQYANTPPSLTRFDYERQCVGNLKREGFVCVSGC